MKIATPIEWEELDTTVFSSKQFNFANILEGINEKWDIWDKAKTINSNIYFLIE
jgi:DNA primase